MVIKIMLNDESVDFLLDKDQAAVLFEDLCSFVLHLFYSQGNMVGKCGCIQEPHYFALLKQVCFSFV